MGLKITSHNDIVSNSIYEQINYYPQLGNEDILRDQKIQLDAAVPRQLGPTISEPIANSLLRFQTTFYAFCHIEIYYGDKKLQELIRLEIWVRNIHFAEHFRPVQFISDFESIIDEYRNLGTIINEETLVAKFLAGIDSSTYRDIFMQSTTT